MLRVFSFSFLSKKNNFLWWKNNVISEIIKKQKFPTFFRTIKRVWKCYHPFLVNFVTTQSPYWLSTRYWDVFTMITWGSSINYVTAKWGRGVKDILTTVLKPLMKSVTIGRGGVKKYSKFVWRHLWMIIWQKRYEILIHLLALIDRSSVPGSGRNSDLNRNFCNFGLKFMHLAGSTKISYFSSDFLPSQPLKLYIRGGQTFVLAGRIQMSEITENLTKKIRTCFIFFKQRGGQYGVFSFKIHSNLCVQRPPSGPQICGRCWQVVVVQS